MLLLTMEVCVLSFGILKDSFGGGPARVEMPEGSTVGDLLERLGNEQPRAVLRGIAVSVNAEYAQAERPLRHGDEVGLLPPVSGGKGEDEPIPASEQGEGEGPSPAFAALTREAIDAEGLIAAAKCGGDGAVVVFDGIVRNNTRGRETLFLEYEAYEEMALKQMRELAARARRSFAVRQATIVHRLGRLEVGETSVLIVVASAHRAQAFDACRWLIDTLKKTVPIWKRETFADGAVWSAGEPFPEKIAVSQPEAAHG